MNQGFFTSFLPSTSQVLTVKEYDSSGSYVIQPGTKSLLIMAIGGGGGGGGGSLNTITTGNGGAGGNGYVVIWALS